jgi:hypothetical protein
MEVIELSDPENTKEAHLSEEKSAEEARETSLPEEKPVEEAKEPPKVPEPTAIGDEKITILKHDIYRKSGEGDITEAIGIELVVKNVSDKMIGCAVFEAILYDIEGNILDTAEHKIIELNPNVSRTLRINYSELKCDKVKSYDVRVVKTVMTPVPTAAGNDKIIIIKHNLSERGIGLIEYEQPVGVELAIRNVSDSTIATAVFEAVFYDIEGNIVDTVKHREIDLKLDTSRAIFINSSIAEHHKVKSYDVRVIRATTTDVEKVQLRRHEMRTTDTSEEVRGTVKNISEVKTDAAVVVTFYDPKKENIGTKVIILRDIEPNTIRQYYFRFKPQEGDRVRSSGVAIGEIAG